MHAGKGSRSTMVKNAFAIWKELKSKYKEDIQLVCSPSCSDCQRGMCSQQKSIWIQTSPSHGGERKWWKVRTFSKGLSYDLCQIKKCDGKKCKKPHSKMEKAVWERLAKNGLYLNVFVHTALLPDEAEPEDVIRQPSKSRRHQKTVARRTTGEYGVSNRAELDKFFGKWKGRFLFVCKQCYCLEPKVIKEMEIGDGRQPQVYCAWCLGKKALLLHELTYTNPKKIKFYEYNAVRPKPPEANDRKCRYFEDCSKGDECPFPHSELEFDYWALADVGIFLSVVRDRNTYASAGRDTLNGMFHCDHCCLSFLQAADYHKYMKRPHVHFEKICRSVTTWKYGPLSEHLLEKSVERCQQRCPGKGICKKAHSDTELARWNEFKKIANERSRFSLQTDATWYDLKEIPQDISVETRVKVTVSNRSCIIGFDEKSLKWTLVIETFDKEFNLHKVGFHTSSGFEVRKLDEEKYRNVISIDDHGQTKHAFKILFINPKTYGTRNADLICEFTGSKRYRVEFQVTIKGESVVIPEKPKLHDDWAQKRDIIRYDKVGMELNNYEKEVRRIVLKYPQPSYIPENELNMSELCSQNYADTMHHLLYAEEESRRSVLSRLNIECEIEFGELLPNGNMLGNFDIPISISTDEALLFNSSCQMVLIGADHDRYSYECKIINISVEGEIDNQDKEKVTIDVPTACCREMGLQPKTKVMHKIQFQLDRQLFCLRHYAVDNIGDKIAFLCPAEESVASMAPLADKKMCKQLDVIQDVVYRHIKLAKMPEDDAKSFPPLIVAGPFGTGKTYTIRQILLNLLENSSSTSILVCTHSNSAADLYFEDHRLRALGPGKILRVVYHGRSRFTLSDNANKFCLVDEHDGKYRYPTLSELRRCKLVVTTFTASMALFMQCGVTAGLFSHIFLDEASQAMEADVIMPLLLADCKNTRIILAGDHRQTTEKMYCDERGLIKTLLERLYENHENDEMIKTVLLRNNYRCVKEILDLISKLFYKKNALKNVSRAECIPGIKSVFFIHVQGECVKTQKGDYANQSEAYQILYEVDMLVRKRQILNQEDIVVVSSFHSQIDYIRMILRQNGLRDVVVQSIQNIQGQEYKAVILTTVLRRINCLKTPGENFGFLSDYRLLNVALSRAQSLVVVVGDAVTLCSIGKCSKDWKKYLQYCEESAAILPKNVNVESVKSQISLAKKELRASAKEFKPGIVTHVSQILDEDTHEQIDANTSASPSDTDCTSSYDDDDDSDSWCSEESLDDIILDDMVRDKTAIALSKITIRVDKDLREYIQYESEDDAEEDDDPNEVLGRPSRRQQLRRAIYPKFTIEQLEQMHKLDKAKYKRCKINVRNWFSAEAVPLPDDEDENPQKELPDESGSHECNKSNSDNEDEDHSDGERYEFADQSDPVISTPITRISPVIYIETRLNLGRTFDQDEALVEIIGSKRDPTNPSKIKRYGKVLGIISKREIHPRNRYFLCRPNEFSPYMMNPYDRKLTLFATLSPLKHQHGPEKVPMYKFGPKERMNNIRNVKFIGYEQMDETRVYVVRYLKWSECCMYPLGFVESSFELTDFQRYLSLEYRVPSGHKKEILDEVKMMEQPDFDDLPCIDVFTIDPEGATDLDDAISFCKCSKHVDCYEIGVHITNVASLVEEGSAIDRDAQKRISTFYGPEEPIHMLPRGLSTDRCSILPNEVRPAISTTFHSSCPPYSDSYIPIQPERTYIKSSRQLTYKEAETFYKAVELDELEQIDLSDEKYAQIIHDMWAIMWKWRLARLHGEAFYKRTDTFEHILESHAHLVIEEAMIATNNNTALYLTQCVTVNKQRYEIPMRAQAMPEEEDWTRWEKAHSNLIPNSCYLKSLKKHLKRRQRVEDGGSESDSDDDDSESENEEGWEHVPSRSRRKSKWNHQQAQEPAGPIQARDSITIFKKYWMDMLDAKNEGCLDLFTFIAACDDLHPSLVASVNGFISTQTRAYFVTDNSYHFSLRLPKYAWSTSPIRRYSDILIQRCILKSLQRESLTENTEQTIKRFCLVTDYRHKEFEQKLNEAHLAKSFEDEPLAFEACIEQVTDAFVKISIPLAKFIKKQKLQIQFGNLMVGTAEADQSVDSSAVAISSMKLGWKLRYYKYSPESTYRDEPVSVVKIPINVWREFVDLLSSRPSLREIQVDRFKSDLQGAIKSLDDAAEVENDDTRDNLTGETPNRPEPIKHKREIEWEAKLGTSVLVQLSGSLDTSRLPTPDIQLFSIANNLDVCVEHMKSALTVFASDSKPFNGEIKTLVQYQKKWEPLVRMDAASNAVKENSSITIDGVKIDWKKQRTSVEGSFLDHDETDSDDSFKLQHGFCSDRYIEMHNGDLLCLRLKGVYSKKRPKDRYHSKLSSRETRSCYTAVVHALVTAVDEGSEKSRDTKKTVTFRILSGAVPAKVQNIEKNLWTIEIIPLSFAHRYMQRALHGIALPTFHCDLLGAICLGIISPMPVPWNEDIKKKWIGRPLKKFPFKLNKEQHDQEERAIKYNFSLIQGPPGTGKSFLGAQIAAKFAYMNKDGGTENKVLYVGPSNKSVDVAAKYLKDISDLKVVRMYSKSLEEKLYPNPLKPKQSSAASEEDSKKPDSELKLVTLHEMIRFPGKKFSKEIKEYDARVKGGGTFTRSEMAHYDLIVQVAKMRELRNADIVICTCSCSCQLLDMFDSDNEEAETKFSQCIIDECAMCSEPETILPLFAVKPDQVVLIGDHMQLRPVITCNKAERLGLSKSLFMRYKDYVGMLTRQYRMHPHIMSFPSEHFYDNRLICDESVLRRRSPAHGNPFKSIKSRVIFWNVKGVEGVRHFKTKDEGDQSKSNSAQASAVVKLLHRLHSYNIPIKDIMILSPYTAQCARIREMLQRHSTDLAQVHVGTVVTSQGSEAEYVILSTVRALPSPSIMRCPNLQWLRKHLGFISDPNQINVALTRAKTRLFIIGDKELLEVDALWKDLLIAYQKMDAITDNLLSR